jgi:prepilin-type N-terminal cleavage/methylation domain-containing protein
MNYCSRSYRRERGDKFMKFLRKLRSEASGGFTLIELVMVMSIIGVLAGALVLIIPRGTERARDTQRKSDLSQYRAALELFANKNNGYYPVRPQIEVVDSAFCVDDLGLTAGMCPQDPRDGSANCNGSVVCRYYYQSNNQGCGDAGSACATGYVMWTGLEMPSDAENTDYYVVCSDGRSGELASSGGFPPAPADSATCPL